MIQLRQADAQTVTANGEYECFLSKDITIENGDVVQLSKAFVDSVKEGDINIVEDLTLSVQSGVYFTNWTTLTGNFINNENQNVACEGSAPSFRRFIPYLPVDDLVGYSQYLQYNYNFVYKGDKFGPINMTYSYINFLGQTQYFHTSIPPIPAGSYNQQLRDNFNVIALNDSIKIVSPSLATLASEYGLTPIGPIGTPVDSKHYIPFTFNTKISLPKGVYSPTQISTYISQQLSLSGLFRNTNSSYTNMNKTFFQFAVSDFDNGKPNPNGQLNPDPPYAPVTLTEQTTFISDDTIFSYKFPAGSNLILGTSQIALEYSQENDAFQFTQIHMPMLDASVGQNTCVRYLWRGLVENAGVYGVSENSGIYFNSLTATNANGRLVDFWGAVLGFDLSKLCVGNGADIIDTYGLTGIISLSAPLTDGINCTNGYYGLDSAIVRGVAGNADTWYQRQPVPYLYGTAPVSPGDAQAGICSTINSTNYIQANKTLDILLNKFSHYFLQTDLGFNDNNFIGEKWYHH